MLVVISPAKNLDLTSELPAVRQTQPSQLSDAQALITELQRLAPQEVAQLMGLSDKLALLNYQRFQSWHTPFTQSNSRPAVFTFNGDVYQGLDAARFNADELNFAQQHLRILSGLYGVLRPLDRMQAYRLEMGTRFANARGRDLYAFWGERITTELNRDLKRVRSQWLVNLASQEYFRAVVPANLAATVIEPVFKDWKSGAYKIVSFFAKKARGRMSAYIVKHRLTDPEGLKHYNWDGYHYNESMSSPTQWVFTRKA